MVMIELLRLQAQSQAHTLTSCVVELARDPLAVEQLDACASAARMFEGTANMAGLPAGATLARTMEECFVGIRRGEIQLQQELLRLMLQSVDLLDCMAKVSRATPMRMPAGVGARKERRLRSTGKRVLVVETSREERELEAKLLKFSGYEVVTATDGIDAWYAIRDGAIDLVLSGVDMPLLDGFQLTRFIRKDPRFKRLPILLACDNDNTQQRWSAFDAGANYYVLKGQLNDTLLDVVATLIGPAQQR